MPLQNKNKSVEEAKAGIEPRLKVKIMSETQLKCAKCGSSKIIPQAEIEILNKLYSSGEITVYTAKRPDAAVFQQREHSGLAARVCGECGYTELYTFRFTELYNTYLEGEQHRLPL